jgi:hypothetical protein
MLFVETAAVYFENHTEHTDTVRTSQETHYASVTEPNRLMLIGETVALVWADSTYICRCGLYYYIQTLT